MDTTGKSEDEEGAYPGGLVKELRTSLEAIGGTTQFLYLSSPSAAYTKPYKKEKKIQSKLIIVIFFSFVSYKINKQGDVVAKPL